MNYGITVDKQGNFTIDLHKYEQGAGTIYVSGTADVTVKNESNAQFKGNFCWSGADAKLTLTEGERLCEALSYGGWQNRCRPYRPNRAEKAFCRRGKYRICCQRRVCRNGFERKR